MTGLPSSGKSTFVLRALESDAWEIPVLVAAEEGLRGSGLAERIARLEATKTQFSDAASFPEITSLLDEHEPDVLAIDSATALGLQPEDMLVLRQNYPTTAFVAVVQSVKSGSHAGSQGWLHDADAVVRFEGEGRWSLIKSWLSPLKSGGVGPYPLHDDYEVLDWRSQALELAAARAASGEEATWDIKKVVDKVEEHARRRAEKFEALENGRAYAAEQERLVTEAETKKSLALARVTDNRWAEVTNGLGDIVRSVEEAQASFADIDAAERALAIHQSSVAQAEASARRRKKGKLLSIGVALGAGALAGHVMRTEPENKFNFGAAVGVGLGAGLVAYAFSKTLVEDTGEIMKGASIVTGLARRVA